MENSPHFVENHAVMCKSKNLQMCEINLQLKTQNIEKRRTSYRDKMLNSSIFFPTKKKEWNICLEEHQEKIIIDFITVCIIGWKDEREKINLAILHKQITEELHNPQLEESKPRWIKPTQNVYLSIHERPPSETVESPASPQLGNRLRTQTSIQCWRKNSILEIDPN